MLFQNAIFLIFGRMHKVHRLLNNCLILWLPCLASLPISWPARHHPAPANKSRYNTTDVPQCFGTPDHRLALDVVTSCVITFSEQTIFESQKQPRQLTVGGWRGRLHYFSLSRISWALIPSDISCCRTLSSSAFLASSAAAASCSTWAVSSLAISLSSDFTCHSTLSALLSRQQAARFWTQPVQSALL